MSRDIEADKRLCEKAKVGGFLEGIAFLPIITEMGKHYINELETERERLNKAESQIHCLVELIKNEILYLKASENNNRARILERSLNSLYPKEETE